MEKININKRVVNKTNTFQVTNDIIVPDIKPDIINIIATNGIPYIYKQDCENGRIKMDGSVDCYIVYLSVDGDTRSIQTTFSFSNALENINIKESSNIKYKITIGSIESKILNERKISVVTTITIEYIVSEMQTIEISNDILDNIPMLQIQKENMKIKSLVGCNTAKTSIKENVDIDNLDEIAEILKINIDIVRGEQKISYNKVLTKGECNVNIIYMTEDNRIGSLKNTFPIMSFIDLENIKEEDTCFIDYNIKNMLFKINNREDHNITVQIDFEIYCEAYEEKELMIIKDAYSLSNDVDISYKNIDVENYSENINEEINISERIRIEDIKRVLTLENKKLLILKKDSFNIEGEINLILYYEVSNKTGLNVKELKIPFISKNRDTDECEIICNNIEQTLSGEELNLNIKLSIRKSENSHNNIELIDNIKVSDNSNGNDYSVVVYIVKKNDTIWKIAKCFKVTTESLIKINNLQNPDLICPGDKLYILR